MNAYHNIVRQILAHGVRRPNRTGVDTLALPAAMFQHNMSQGFPLLTTKRMAIKAIRVELEGFIKGITDKKWYQDRGCHIWDEWCNPEAVDHDRVTANVPEDIKAAMKESNDLGPIYGYQWRRFNTPYPGPKASFLYNPEGFRPIVDSEDQLAEAVRKLKETPDDRRIIVSAWNPTQLHQMALPPCHLLFQLLVIAGHLHLNWYQRSVDTALGLPFNIASYGMLLHLLAKECGYEEGMLTGMLGDTHIYENHILGLREQLERRPRDLPKLETKNFTSIFDWEWNHTKIKGYNPHPKISFEIAV